MISHNYLYANSLIVSFLSKHLMNVIPNLYSNEGYKFNNRSIKDITLYHLDKFLYIISCIYFRKTVNQKIESWDEFVNLNAATLQTVIGKKNKQIIEALVELGVIESDNHFIRNKKSRGYRLGKEWRKLAAAGSLPFFRYQTALPVQKTRQDAFLSDSYALKCFDKIFFDAELAGLILKELSKSEKAREKIDYYNFLIDSWANKQFFYIKSKKTGRLFTLLTSTSKEFRKCLYFLNDKQEKEQLFNCDIKSCQPLLLYTFYQSKTPESQKYKELVESGQFYQSIIDFLGLPFTEDNKSIYKDRIWEYAFGKQVYSKIYCIDDYFTEIFPELRNLIKSSKNKLEITEDRPHTKVAIKLQKMESEVMIDLLLPFAEKLDIPLLTIHDSFLCRKQDIQVLMNFVIQKFQEKYGLTPNFDVKMLDYV